VHVLVIYTYFSIAHSIIHLFQMVRNYIRKTSRASYGSTALSSALKALENGQPLKATARQYGIPAKTLRRHRDDKVKQPGVSVLGRHKCVFPPEYEDMLVRHILAMENAFYGLTTMDIRRLAFDLAERMNLHHPFSKNLKLAGSEWLRSFLKRHPQLSLRAPQATSISRIVGFNKPKVDRFFSLYGDELSKCQFQAKDIWNMDESGITNVHTPAKVVASKGRRQISKVTSGEKGRTVTVVCCMSAGGSFIPPMMIFPRKRMLDLLLKGSPPGTIGAASPNGWTDNTLFIQWLRHFMQHTKCSKEEPCILIMDGHQSHKSLEAIELAREHGVIMVTLPPHCTHRMQPLDRTFFKSLKMNYNAACDDWMRCHPGRRISFFEMAELFHRAYAKSATHEKAVHGFECTGLWPYNSQLFSAEDFEAAEVTNEDNPASHVAAESGDSVTEPQLDQPSDDVAEDADAEPTTAADCQEETINNDQSVEVAELNSSDRDAAAHPSHPGLAEALEILQSLSPRPKILKPRTRKRKMESAAVITSSPYKQALQEKQQMGSKPKDVVLDSKKSKTKTKKSSNKTKDKKKFPTSTLSTDKTPCLYCEEPYCNSEEGFVQCSSCSLWAHYSCAGYDPRVGGSFVCELCQ